MYATRGGEGDGGYSGKNGCWVCADPNGRFFHLQSLSEGW